MYNNNKNSNGPVISVVMAAYNEEVSIGSAIESIVNQTYTDWELIIVDDCSRDKTSEILNHYVNAFPGKIKSFRNTSNLGLARSLNKGLSLCSGMYIARMDADDWSFSERLQKQIDFMESHPNIDVLGTGAVLVGTNGESSNTICLCEHHEEIKTIALRKTIFFHPSVMMRKSFFSHAGMYNDNMPLGGEDIELWIRGLNNGCIYHNLQEPLIKYTTNDYVRSTKSILGVFYSKIYICLKYKYYRHIPVCIISMVSKFARKYRLYTPKTMS